MYINENEKLSWFVQKIRPVTYFAKLRVYTCNNKNNPLYSLDTAHSIYINNNKCKNK